MPDKPNLKKQDPFLKHLSENPSDLSTYLEVCATVYLDIRDDLFFITQMRELINAIDHGAKK